jgi:hypothetical protein
LAPRLSFCAHDPGLAQAEELLDDIAQLWTAEPDPAERCRLLALLFDRLWQDGGRIVAVRPRAPFLGYFQAVQGTLDNPTDSRGDNNGSDGTRTRDLRRDRTDEDEPETTDPARER